MRDEREEGVPGGDAGPEPRELLQLRERADIQPIERDDGPCGAREADDPLPEQCERSDPVLLVVSLPCTISLCAVCFLFR